MAKPMSLKTFLNVDYTQTGDEFQATNAKKRKRDIGAGTDAEYSSTNPPSKDEALTVQQRLKMARTFKKNKAKIAMGRKRAARKVASIDKLRVRAKKQARNTFLKKITKGIDKGELSLSRRASIEKRLDKMKPKIDKLAVKMLPKVRKAELEKKRGGKKSD
jgi:hypothetical protein